MDSLGIDGAWGYTPQVHPDDRGHFLEVFRGADFAADLGRRLDVAQVNCSVSRRGVIRGIHYCDVPPGQAKYVSCVSGAILDVIVDLRAGSPPSASGRPCGSMTPAAARYSFPRGSAMPSWR